MNRLHAPKKQTQFKPCPELAEALSPAEGAVEWANFHQEIPKMPYLLVCEKRYYAGTVEAVQAGTCFSGLIFLLILWFRRYIIM